MTRHSYISETKWHLLPNDPIKYKGSFHAGGYNGYETVCNQFIDSNSAIITPSFQFSWKDGTNAPSVNHTTCHEVNKSDTQLIANQCSSLSFRLDGEIDASFEILDSYEVIGRDCDAGL